MPALACRSGTPGILGLVVGLELALCLASYSPKNAHVNVGHDRPSLGSGSGSDTAAAVGDARRTGPALWSTRADELLAVGGHQQGLTASSRPAAGSRRPRTWSDHRDALRVRPASRLLARVFCVAVVMANRLSCPSDRTLRSESEKG